MAFRGSLLVKAAWVPLVSILPGEGFSCSGDSSRCVVGALVFSNSRARILGSGLCRTSKAPGAQAQLLSQWCKCLRSRHEQIAHGNKVYVFQVPCCDLGPDSVEAAKKIQ